MIYYIKNIDMLNAMLQVELYQYYADIVIFILTVICYVYVFFSEKELRYKFLLPIAAILFIIWNPIIYIYVFRGNAYWRLFWMIPNSVIIGMSLVIFLRKREKAWMKWGAVALLAVILSLSGNNVFQEQEFIPRENWEKVSQDTIDICDMMLELDENPRAIVSENLFCEIRQYTPDIELMYGRDAHAYIREMRGLYYTVFANFETNQPNYNYVLTTASEWGYNFIVVDKDREIKEYILKEKQYEEIGRTSEYIIYYNKEIKNVPKDDK